MPKLLSEPGSQEEVVSAKSGTRDFLLLLASRVVSLAAGVVFVAVTARLFPAAGVAFLAWVVIASNAVETVRGFGLTNVLTRRLPLCTEHSLEAQRWVATHFVFASAPLLVLPFLLSTVFPLTWTLAAVGAAMQLVVNNHIYVFQAMGQFRVVAISSILSTLFQRVAPLAVGWYWHLDLERFLLIQAVFSLPVCAMLTFQLRKYLFSRVLVSWTEFWPQARAFYAAGFVRYGATQADQLLVALLFPPQTLAPYFLVRRLYSALVVVLSAGIDVLIPRLGRHAADGMAKIHSEQARILKTSTAFCALGGCLAAANAGTLVPLLVGPNYAAPPYVVPALMVAALGYGLFSFALAGEVIAGPPSETFRITLVAALVPLGVTPFFVPMAGVAGLPLALAAGYIIAAWLVFSRTAELRVAAVVALAVTTAIGLLGAAQEGILAGPIHIYPSPLVLNLVALSLAAMFVLRCRLPFRSLNG